MLARNLEREYPMTNRDRGAAVRTMYEMRTQASDANWKFGVIFTTLALVVLLVACTNAAGLLLSRARARTREIAVRLAIGAGRFRLIRLLLTESLVLALLGGLGGIAIGYIGIHFLGKFRIPAELPVRIPFRMDTHVLLASLAFSVLSALICGLAPALQSTRLDLVKGLKSSDGDLPGVGRKRLWGRNALVVAQIAMSLMLLAASFLMFRGFQHSLSEGLEFAEQARDHVLMVRFDPRLVQYDASRTEAFYRQLAERVREAPGVRSAGFTLNPPLGLGDFGRIDFVPEGFQMPRDRESFRSPMDTVDQGFFETMGIPILHGRGFRSSDDAGATRVAIVNGKFANHYWPGADPVGKRVRLESASGAPVEIVGVAQTIKFGDGPAGESDFVYVPFAQHPSARMVLLVRSDGDPSELVPGREGRGPRARSQHADAADDDVRGALPVCRRRGAGRRRQAGRHAGRGGGAPRHRRTLRRGGLQREPPDARDRHPHGDRRPSLRRPPVGVGQGTRARGLGHGDRPRDGVRPSSGS